MQKFDCDQCGACCRSLIVEADWLDAVREPKLLSLKSDVKSLDELRNSGRCLVLYDTETHACPFLVGQHGEKCSCSIYPTRPNVCVISEPGGPKCQQARLLKSLPVLRDKRGDRPDVTTWRDDFGHMYDDSWLEEIAEEVAIAP